MFGGRGARGLGWVCLVCLLVDCLQILRNGKTSKNSPFAANSLTNFVSRISFAIVKVFSWFVLPGCGGKKVPAVVLRRNKFMVLPKAVRLACFLMWPLHGGAGRDLPMYFLDARALCFSLFHWYCEDGGNVSGSLFWS